MCVLATCAAMQLGLVACGVEVPSGESAAEPGAARQGSHSSSYFMVYVKPGGTLTVNDDLDGRSLANAVGSLHAAQLVLRRHNVKSQNVEVWISQGTYTGQSVYWYWDLNAGYEILFQGDTAARPVFEGCAAADTSCTTYDIADGYNSSGSTVNTEDSFFVSGLPDGSDERFRFERLRIFRYRNGIRLEGRYSTIHGCEFNSIGNGWDDDVSISLDIGYAAVRLPGADDVTINNNTFDKIWNKIGQSGWSAVHAVYLAYGAERNVITNNDFIRVSGDPIRTRDCSNSNDITYNTFIRTGSNAVVYDWQSDTSEGESWNNEVRNNTWSGDWECASISLFGYVSTGHSSCQPGTASRFYTSGNSSTSDCGLYSITDLCDYAGDC